MQCTKCNSELQPILNLPGVRRISFPHVCKQIPKLGIAYVGSRIEPWGVGTDWMPQAYGEYYAKHPAVYAAVKLRSDAVLAAPLRAYRRLTDGNREELPPEHPLSMLLSKVNPWWTKGDLLRATSIYLDLWGSVFWLLKKSGPSSLPTEVWVPRPDKMHIIPSQTDYIAGYWYQANIGTRIPFRPDEVIWFRQINPLDEYAGMSPIASARLSIDMGREGLQHNRNIFKNGILSGTLSFSAKDATMTAEQAKEFREALKERYSRPENSHIPLITGNFDVKNLGLTNRDMEFMAALRWSLEDVARVYSIPKPMLGDLERATYENIDAAERIFWRSSMVPHLRFMQDELNEMLLPMFGPDLEVEFDTTVIEALQEDANAAAERHIKEVQAGIRTINEVRELQGLEPVPWGDVAWLPFTVQPIETPEDAQAPMSPFAPPNEEEPPPRALPMPRRSSLVEPSNSWRKFHEPEYSDIFIGKIQELYERGLSRSENDFQKLQQGLFTLQEREILRRLRAQKDIAAWHIKALPELPIFNLGEWVQRYITRGLPIYIDIVTTAATQQNNAFSLGVSFDMRKIQPWLDRRSEFWAGQVNQETGRLLMQELEEALEGRESIKQIQARVERVFDFSNTIRSERIARTETLAAMNEGALESYRQSGVVERKMWLATLDTRTRDAHLAAHRQVVELEANFLVGGEAISHPGEGSPEQAINCILPGNITVAQGILAASTAKYSGPALELRTKMGRVLTITTNHPILTDKGFIAAKLLHPGDNLIGANLSKRVMGINQNIDQTPPLIEDVFSALDVVLGASISKRSGIPNFHGDWRYMDGNINVKVTDRHLWCTCNTSDLKPTHQYALCLSNILKRPLTSNSSFEEFLFAANKTTNREMSGSRQVLALLGRGPGHSAEHGGASISDLYVPFEKEASYNWSADPKTLSDSLLGFPGKIVLDQLISIREFDFTGQVYDLQTISGLYNANGIFVHNCRCTIAPILSRRAWTPPMLSILQTDGKMK